MRLVLLLLSFILFCVISCEPLLRFSPSLNSSLCFGINSSQPRLCPSSRSPSVLFALTLSLRRLFLARFLCSLRSLFLFLAAAPSCLPLTHASSLSSSLFLPDSLSSALFVALLLRAPSASFSPSRLSPPALPRASLLPSLSSIFLQRPPPCSCPSSCSLPRLRVFVSLSFLLASSPWLPRGLLPEPSRSHSHGLPLCVLPISLPRPPFQTPSALVQPPSALVQPPSALVQPLPRFPSCLSSHLRLLPPSPLLFIFPQSCPSPWLRLPRSPFPLFVLPPSFSHAPSVFPPPEP